MIHFTAFLPTLPILSCLTPIFYWGGGGLRPPGFLRPWCGGAACSSNVSHGGMKETGIADASFTNDI